MLGKNFAPLAEKLNNVEWGEFLLKDLFEISTGSLISSQKLKSGNCPRISVKNFDNGVYGMFDTKNISDARHHKNFITVNFFGNAFYHPYEASIEMKVHALKLKNKEFTSATGLFITSVINYSLKDKFSYGDQLSSSDLKNLNIKIKLPTKNGEIDFEFMEKFITKLEAERITELEAYLKENNLAYLTAAGLKDFILTDEEKFALENLNSCIWQKFLLKDLFGESTRGKRLKSDDRIEGNLPFVTAGETDEGISAYIGNEVKIFSKNTITIDMFGSAKYRNYNYGADDHIAVVHTEKISKFASIFVTVAIHKSSHNGQFHYGRNFYAKDADSLEIYLPTKDGEIDYEFMEKFITAVQKIIIADVVKYSEEKISAYRQAVNK